MKGQRGLQKMRVCICVSTVGEAGWQSPDLPMSHASAAQQQAHPSALMQATTCWDVRGRSGGEAFATPTCFLLREPLIEVHRERKRGGSDGNAAANGNILSGLGVGLSSWRPSRSRRGCCGDTKALAPVLPNK